MINAQTLQSWIKPKFTNNKIQDRYLYYKITIQYFKINSKHIKGAVCTHINTFSLITGELFEQFLSILPLVLWNGQWNKKPAKYFQF